MLVRQRVKAVTYVVEFPGFMKNCSRRHCVPECLERLRRGKLQVGRLSSGNLKKREEILSYDDARLVRHHCQAAVA